MKKIFALFVVLALAVSMTTTAFAVGNGERETGNVDVKINTDDVLTVYSVDIQWDPLVFTYSHGSGTWDPSDHSISGGKTGWDKTSANVVVTNHSNAAVNIAATFPTTPTTATNNAVTATLSNNTFQLTAGELNNYAGADSKTAIVNVSGTPSVGNDFTVGTITVAVSAVN